MKTTPLIPLYVGCVAVVLISLNAGFFYTWSFTITQSLNLIEASSAVKAMQSVNTNIRTVWFAGIFFGAPVLLLLTTFLLFLNNLWKPTLLFSIASIAAAASVIITMTVHVPMNNELALASPVAASSIQLWTDYSSTWTQWNHLRTTTSVISLIAALAGLISTAKQ